MFYLVQIVVCMLDQTGQNLMEPFLIQYGQPRLPRQGIDFLKVVPVIISKYPVGFGQAIQSSVKISEGHGDPMVLDFSGLFFL